ncbi:hypothetical protein NE237_000978 [Protea cynaroides]|uniref:BAG domain-containing protein n=1 Tax=Protea cynaroides TaxID=273540 RepID=A0A9Q0KSF1_9MAGN|nr:hypothetical protein NE237_000978 [Protea cynaroides]
MKSSRKTRFFWSSSSPLEAKTTEVPIKSNSQKITAPINLRPPEFAAAMKIQSAYRVHLVRKLVKRIKAVNSETDRLERLIQQQATVDAIRQDAMEKVRMNETLMALLLRLDSVPGIFPPVRELRRSATRRVVGLQEILDAVADTELPDSADDFLTNWDQMIADTEEDVCRKRGSEEMQRFSMEKLGFRCFERFLRET